MPPAWLVTGNIAAQGSSGSYVVTMIDKGKCCLTEHGDAPPPPLYPDLATATLAADEQAVIVIGAGSIKEFHATVRPWTDEPALYSGAERELKAEAEPAGNATAFVLEPTGEAGDLLLLVSITFPVDFDPSYPVDNSASYLWRLNPVSGFISEPQAVELAKLYCSQVHSEPKEVPHNIQTELITWQSAREKLKDDSYSDRLLDMKVWLVSMDGTWLHEGPPPPEGTPNVPLTFSRCRVVIDARTGDMMVATN